MLFLLVIFVIGFIFLQYKKQARDNIFGLKVGGSYVSVEVADEPQEWLQGLSGRKFLAEGAGMLFIFPFSEIQTFWNKNTFLPLDVVWIQDEEIVGYSFLPAQIEGSEPVMVRSPAPVNRVLEVGAGWMELNLIKPGDRVYWP